VQTKARAPLGRSSTFTNVLTKHVPKEKVEDLAYRMLKGRILAPKTAVHPMLRHHGHHQLCAYVPLPAPEAAEATKSKCHRQKKKKKRKCEEDDDCENRLAPIDMKKCEDGEEEEECQRRLHMIRKKRKSRTDSVKNGSISKRQRLKLEKQMDLNKKFKIKCKSVYKNDEKAVSDCLLKKSLKKRKMGGLSLVTTTMSEMEELVVTTEVSQMTTIPPLGDRDDSEALLWQDHLVQHPPPAAPSQSQHLASSSAMSN